MPLWVVATPIGNLSDTSARCREVLARASLLLCEDTRRTRALLSALQIPAPTLWRCDAHTEASQVQGVLTRLREGADVVLVSDAGTPAISDPGAMLVAAAHAAGLPVLPVPGPSSVAAALSVAGFSATPFHFLGFPPKKAGELDRFVAASSRLAGALVLLCTGRRLAEVIGALARQMPQREAVICRELTKVHESVRRAPLAELPAEDAPGEAVIVIGPGDPVPEAAPAAVGEGLGALAAALATRWGCGRQEAYQALLQLERLRESGL